MIIVRDLKLTLEIEDPRDYPIRLKRQRIFNNTIFAIFIACQILIFGFHFLEYIILPSINKTDALFDGLQYAKISVKCVSEIIDVIMAFYLYSIVKFYIQKK